MPRNFYFSKKPVSPKFASWCVSGVKSLWRGVKWSILSVGGVMVFLMALVAEVVGDLIALVVEGMEGD